MKSEEEIKKYLLDNFEEKLLNLESYRKKKISQIKTGTWISASLLIFSIVFIFTIHALGAVLFIAFFIVANNTVQNLSSLNKYLRSQFKFYILRRLLDFLFDDCTYIPQQRIAKVTILNSLLFPDDISKVEGEDYLRFRIGPTSIHFCETMVYSYSNGNPIFNGIFLSAHFNKNFTQQTLILPRSFKNYRRQFFSELKKVELEDPDFQKEFLVLSTDQVESRYLLSTALMKRMLDYKHKTGKNISFSFTGNLLHCIVPNYINLFEPALFDSFLDMNYLRKSLQALELYTDIVDDLNLNVRIWNKN